MKAPIPPFVWSADRPSCFPSVESRPALSMESNPLALAPANAIAMVHESTPIPMFRLMGSSFRADPVPLGGVYTRVVSWPWELSAVVPVVDPVVVAIDPDPGLAPERHDGERRLCAHVRSEAEIVRADRLAGDVRLEDAASDVRPSALHARALPLRDEADLSGVGERDHRGDPVDDGLVVLVRRGHGDLRSDGGGHVLARDAGGLERIVGIPGGKIRAGERKEERHHVRHLLVVAHELREVRDELDETLGAVVEEPESGTALRPRADEAVLVVQRPELHHLEALGRR